MVSMWLCVSVMCCVGEQNVTTMLDDTRRHEQRYVVLTFWDSQVAVVGIGLCAGVIVASLSFVCYQRLTMSRLRAKQDTQTPAYRALVASNQKHADARHGDTQLASTGPGRLQPRSPRVTTACLSSRTAHRAAAIKLSTSSPVKQRDLTPASVHRLRDGASTVSPVTSTRATAAQLSIFTPTCSESPAMRSARAHCKSSREAFECVCLVPASAGVVDDDRFMLETRPPVEGRDSLTVEHVLDTAVSEPSSAELKTASYVPPTDCSVAVRRSVERVEEPTQVTRGTSPMSTSDVDVLPDISALLTSGTETDDVDDVMTMRGAASSSSLSDLVASCDAEFDSDDCTPRPHTSSLAASQQPRLYKAPAWSRRSPWSARKRQRNAMLEPDVYYC